MRIAYATRCDARDIRQGSGTWYYLAKELQNQGHHVLYLGPLEYHFPAISRILRSITIRMKRRYLSFLDPFVGCITGQEIAAKLQNQQYDILLTNDFAIAAFTSISKPIILYTDVMIPLDRKKRNLPHSRHSNLNALGLILSIYTIRQGLKRANLCIFPAEWCAKEAIRYYRCAEKIHIVPFGANIEDPGPEIVQKRITKRLTEQNRITLLFVGKDWYRKGGPVAIETVVELHKRGINAYLHLVGSIPPAPVDEKFIFVHGLLDKTDPSQAKKLWSLYEESDLMILPSSSEGYVICALEAAAFGLPVVAYDTIGVREAVKDGETGLLLPLGVKGEFFAEEIINLLSNRERYNRLVIGARNYYENSANWKTTVKKLMEIITKEVGKN